MASLAHELEHAKAELARWQTIVDYLESRNGSTPAPRQRRARRVGKVTAAQAAETVLSRSKEPMRVKELLPLVQAEGARIADSEGLSKTLARHPRFVKAGRGLWTLAQE